MCTGSMRLKSHPDRASLAKLLLLASANTFTSVAEWCSAMYLLTALHVESGGRL